MKSADADMRHADLQALAIVLRLAHRRRQLGTRRYGTSVASPWPQSKRAKDVLRVIDQRAGHRLRRVGEKEQREPRDVVRVQQAAERHACGGLRAAIPRLCRA